jgi:hypothetical protein
MPTQNITHHITDIDFARDVDGSYLLAVRGEDGAQTLQRHADLASLWEAVDEIDAPS